MEENDFSALSLEIDDNDILTEPDYFQNQDPPQEDTQNTETTVSEEQNQNNQEAPSNPESYEDFTLDLLKLKGISDPTKIKFQDESGAVIERNWNDLSKNERLSILSTEMDAERDLDDSEIHFINTLRKNNLTPQQYVQLIQKQAVDSYQQQLEQNTVPTYEIDSLTDDELFALDLIEKVGKDNITDEELQQAISQAKANENLYAKQIESLRVHYKNLEDQAQYDYQQNQLQQYETMYRDFSDKVLNQINGLTSFAGHDLELSTDDKNDIANYMLTRRDSGYSDFYSDMQNPEVATLAAFWLVKGPEIIESLGSQIRNAYQRGFNTASNSKPVPKNETATQNPEVVIQPSNSKTSTKPDFNGLGVDTDFYLNT